MSRIVLSIAMLAATVMLFGCDSGGSQKFDEKKAAIRSNWEQSRSTMVAQLALEAYDHGELEQARERCIEALSMDRDNLALRLLLIRIYLDEGDNDAALRHLEVMHHEDVQSWELDYYTGVAYERKRNFDEALKWYDKAHAKAPNAIEPVQAAVEVLVQTGKLQEAEARVAGRISDKNPDPHLCELAGRLATRNDDHAAAAKHFQKALDADPDNLRYPEMLAMSHRELGNQKDVIRILETHTMKPGYDPPAMVYMMMGEAYLAEGRIGKAITSLNEAAEKDPTNAKTWRALCGAYLADGNFRKAIAAGRDAQKRNPDDPETAILLGYALQLNGDDKQALYVLRNAYRKNPNDALVLCVLGQALHKQGQVDQAQQFYERARRIDPNLSVASVMADRVGTTPQP